MLQVPPASEYKEYLMQFTGFFNSPEEAEQYFFDSKERMQIVLKWLRYLQTKQVHKVLELGANPYFLTLLMKKYFDFELHLANFFGNSADNGTHTQTVKGINEEHEFHYAHFNVEVDKFPYENNSFDCVLFCEIIEHLVLNPDFAVKEMKRILKPDGYLIITTPNVTRIYNVVRLLRGINIYKGYSPNGIYGRHNREYTLPEIIELLKQHQFKIVETQVSNIGPHPWKSSIVRALRPRLWNDHLFVLAKGLRGVTARPPSTSNT